MSLVRELVDSSAIRSFLPTIKTQESGSAYVSVKAGEGSDLEGTWAGWATPAPADDFSSQQSWRRPPVFWDIRPTAGTCHPGPVKVPPKIHIEGSLLIMETHTSGQRSHKNYPRPPLMETCPTALRVSGGLQDAVLAYLFIYLWGPFHCRTNEKFSNSCFEPAKRDRSEGDVLSAEADDIITKIRINFIAKYDFTHTRNLLWWWWCMQLGKKITNNHVK